MKHPVDAYSFDGAAARPHAIKPELNVPKRSWLSVFGWIAFVAVLGLSWRSADMRPLDLFADPGNMVQFGRDFFPPDFHDWRTYVHEMIVTLAVAVWGTALSLVFAVPCGLLSAYNIAPVWVAQPVRRVMDACRAVAPELWRRALRIALAGLRHADLSGDPPDETVIDRLYNDQKK